MKKVGISVTLLLACIALPTVAAAAPSAQTGEIVLEQDAVRGDPYETVQDRTISVFKELLAALDTLPNGGTLTSAPLSEPELTYLNSAYLVCSNATGTCPSILDAILELDIVRARLSSAQPPTCPQMTTFWKLWLKSDMEQRQNHSVKTGYLNVTEDFRRRYRPRYIQCAATVKAELSSPGSSSEFFKKRYAPESAVRASIAKAVVTLEGIKAKIPNVFRHVGAQ